jgi:hypothetical protein
MFDELLKRIEEINNKKLNEVFRDVQDASEGFLATPDIRPQTFDVTIPGWLERIGNWGTITYYHKNPEEFRGKRKVSKNQFMDRITDEELNKMFGRWEQPKRKGLTKCVMKRKYVNFAGRKYTEVFIIDVKLRKELR